MNRWLPVALAFAATATLASPAQAHRLVDYGWYINCERNNGVACLPDYWDRYPDAHSHMHTIPSSINYICAGGKNQDGTWKNASRCFNWNYTHRADVRFETWTMSRFAGWWQGGGAANWIIVESSRVV